MVGLAGCGRQYRDDQVQVAEQLPKKIPLGLERLAGIAAGAAGPETDTSQVG